MWVILSKETTNTNESSVTYTAITSTTQSPQFKIGLKKICLEFYGYQKVGYGSFALMTNISSEII